MVKLTLEQIKESIDELDDYREVYEIYNYCYRDLSDNDQLEINKK